MNELRAIKHSLPTGSIKQIATELNISEQTVRNYFGAMKYDTGQPTGRHLQPGPDGGVVNLKDTSILDVANRILQEARKVQS